MRSRTFLRVSLGILVLAAVYHLSLAVSSCGSYSTPPRTTILREAHWQATALAPETPPFAIFAAQAAVDTGSLSVTTFLWKAMRVKASATLGRLGYGTGPFTWKYSAREARALKAFQRDLGLRVTGKLDSMTISHLLKADGALNRTDVVLPNFKFYTEAGYVSAQGTMKAVTSALGYPANTVDIECNARTGVCEEATVEFINPELTQVGRIRRNTYRITHWGNADIVAVGEDWPGSDCHATLMINIPSKGVTVHQWCTGDSTAGMFSHGRSEMALKLVDGAELPYPFDGGDLKEVHEELFADKERYMALQRKNTELKDTVHRY